MTEDRLTLFVVILWVDRVQDISHDSSSLNKADAIAAAQHMLLNLDVPDSDYRAFLSQRIADWTGTGTHVTTIDGGKIVMFATTAKIVFPFVKARPA